MATNQQRREAAKRKLDRQLARRAERARRRRIVGVGVTVGVVVIVAGVIVFLATRGGGNATAAGDGGESSTPPASPTSEPAEPPTSGPCQYQPSQQEATKPVELPPDPKPTPAEGQVKASLATSAGEIGLTLDRAKAPCTVQSIEHLVSSGFYDDTPCHRLTTGKGLKVLQCGDPSGKGSGGPGYTIPDEPPTDLKPAGDGKSVIYPRGTVAMAKTAQPNSGGSQFFLVYEDSMLPPNYTVFGTVDEAGLQVLDKIAQAGVKPGSRKPTDGAPATPVTISDAEIAG